MASEVQMNHSGFSTVELLVSLVVAALFLFAGVSFYNTIVRYSTESRNRASADRIAYDYLRRYESNRPATCAPSTPINNVAVPTSNSNTKGLTSPTITVIITCPLAADVPAISKIVARVRYIERGVTKTLEQEVYATQN